jgi:Ca2+-binding EF-hand superfamily protein
MASTPGTGGSKSPAFATIPLEGDGSEERRLRLKQEKYRRMFSQVSNKDLLISASELKGMVLGLGLKASDEDIQAMMQSADINQTYYISFEEFQVMMDKAEEANLPVDERRQAFEAFDQDGDGLVTREDIRRVMDPLMDQPLTPQQVEDMFLEADLDKDGFIDFRDFSVIWAYFESETKDRDTDRDRES